MAELILGNSPASLAVKLTEGSDFVVGIDSQEGEWPEGATISLVFNDPAATTWTATIAGAAADWNVDKATVSELIAAFSSGGIRARLVYTHADADLVWAQGLVSVHQW